MSAPSETTAGAPPRRRGGRPRPGEAANPALPTVQRIRIRFAKRGRLRFLSHRDVARSFERAVRRAAVPVAHSHGFSPHPRLSWVGAAPTGASSEAEYLEIGLTQPVEPAALVAALDAALPAGLDVLAAVEAEGTALADRIDGCRWVIEMPGVEPAAAAAALAALLAETSVVVERVTPSGRRQVDVRAAVVAAAPEPVPDGAALAITVRQLTPAVRPDDVLVALQRVAGLTPPVPAKATRTEQGRLDGHGVLVDPFAPVAAPATAPPLPPDR